MKKLNLVVFSAILMSGLVFGQNEPKAMEIAPDVYLANLSHENPGIVESTIINVMILKLYQPEKDFEKISKKLDELTLESADESTRFKAFVAASYIKYGQDFNWIKKDLFERGEDLHENFYARMQEMYDDLKKSPETYLSASDEPAKK
ncbi:MAG: hypothetical protein JXR46_09560 [Calditrichaceae bacterium]|nr:hypothetical protein [Calditrichaceae bacterium]MBN2709279.1 hypothetical protein [Calditrichaceae bacterium]RQV91975.1 MAG: hypothetical protein EH224_16745 [Calditrichota bacterium]